LGSNTANPTVGWKVFGIIVEIGSVRETIQFIPGQEVSSAHLAIQSKDAFGVVPVCHSSYSFFFEALVKDDGPCTNCANYTLYPVTHIAKRFTLPVYPANPSLYYQNYTITCPCKYRTHSVDDYAVDCLRYPSAPYYTAACLLQDTFDYAFEGGITLGTGCANISYSRSISFSDYNAVKYFMRNTTNYYQFPSILTNSYVDPTFTEAGSLAVELLALTLSDGFDRAYLDYQSSCFNLHEIQTCSVPGCGDTFYAYTIGDLLNIGNQMLGGCSYSFSDTVALTTCLHSINTLLRYQNTGVTVLQSDDSGFRPLCD